MHTSTFTLFSIAWTIRIFYQTGLNRTLVGQMVQLGTRLQTVHARAAQLREVGAGYSLETI
jgi:hypothetical protein